MRTPPLKATPFEGGARVGGLIKASRPGRPLVSIVTAVRNGERHLEPTIRSILDQTYDNVEYIVVDGQSTDGTVEMLRQYGERIDYWCSEPDAGIYDAMNKGIAQCRGDLVGIIGAGDRYEPEAVAKVVAAFSAEHADVVYGDVNIVDAETGIAFPRRARSDLMPLSMSSINHPSAFVRRALYLERAYDTRWRIAADYDLMLEYYVNGRRFAHAGAKIVNILTGGVSGSFATQVEVFHVHRKYYGMGHALRQFLPTAVWHVLYTARRRVLEAVLSPAKLAMARAWWLRRRRGRSPA